MPGKERGKEIVAVIFWTVDGMAICHFLLELELSGPIKGISGEFEFFVGVGVVWTGKKNFWRV